MAREPRRNIIRKKIMAVMAAACTAVILASPAAQAADSAWYDGDADGIPDSFETTGWWNNSDPTSTGEGVYNWAYKNYPVACNTDPALHAIQVTWVTSNETPLPQTNPTKVDNMLRRGASIIAASARGVITNRSTMLTSRAPRFVTTPGTGLNCNIDIQYKTAPESVANNTDSQFSWAWSQGLTEPNRINLIFFQDADGPNGGGAMTRPYNPSQGQGNSDPMSPNYYQNFAATIAVRVPSLGLLETQNRYNVSAVMAHEIAHAMGAVDLKAPHVNGQNSSHPYDCNDLMCYATSLPNTLGQTYGNGCGTYDNRHTARTSYRLDCNKDDYYSRDNPAWQSERFNGYRSAYLWGNPQPVLNAGLAAPHPTAAPAPVEDAHLVKPTSLIDILNDLLPLV